MNQNNTPLDDLDSLRAPFRLSIIHKISPKKILEQTKPWDKITSGIIFTLAIAALVVVMKSESADTRSKMVGALGVLLTAAATLGIPYYLRAKQTYEKNSLDIPHKGLD